jgi:hypothetical protein
MCFLRNTLCYKVNRGTPGAFLLDNNFPSHGIDHSKIATTKNIAAIANKSPRLCLIARGLHTST